METQANHSAIGTQGAEGMRPGVELAQASADLAVLPLDSLLDLPSNSVGESRDLTPFSQDFYPSFDDDDLPAPAFLDSDLPAPAFLDDDLPAPSFLDDDLPAPSLHADDFPADLTNFGLGSLLGLQLSSAALPTVGEVTRAISQSVELADPEPEEDAEPKKAEADPNAENDEATPDFAVSGDLSFIDPQPLTEQAETNDAAGDIEDEFDAELFGLSLPDPSLPGTGENSGSDDDSSDPGRGPALPPAESGDGGSAGGSGANVINGSAGDDVLNGTAGDDLIHGFAGNDTIDGAAGADRLDGGAGDDVLVWDSADADIDGKTGTDTLRVDNGDIDLTSFGGSMSGLEIVDLQSDAGANIVTLTAQNLLDATDNANILTITGDAGDSLEAGTGWIDGGVDGGGNQIYTQVVGPFTATLAVGPDITPNANILM